MAQINIPRGQSIASVSAPASAAAVNMSAGFNALAQATSAIGAEARRKEQERNRLDAARIQTEYAIRLGNEFEVMQREAPEDGEGLQQRMIERSQEIMGELTADYSEADNPDLFVMMEGVRRRHALAAGDQQSRMYGKAQERQFGDRVNQLSNLARNGSIISHRSMDGEDVGMTLDDYVGMVNGEIDALDVPDVRKKEARSAAIDSVSSSYVMGIIDKGDTIDLQNLLMDLKGDKFSNKLQRRTQETLINETERALTQREQVSTASYKARLESIITAISRSGDSIDLPPEFDEATRSSMLTDSENIKYSKEIAQARTVGRVRQLGRTMSNADLDEFVRSQRSLIDDMDDPVQQGMAIEAMDRAEQEVASIKEWRRADPAAYVMEASEDVKTLWDTYKQAAASGDPSAQAAFERYAAVAVDMQRAYGGNISVLPDSEAKRLRDTITDQSIPITERWAQFSGMYQTSGNAANIVLRDVFTDHSELGQYMMAASLGMGDDSRDAFAAVANYGELKQALPQGTDKEITTAIAGDSTIDTFIATMNDQSQATQNNARNFLRSVATGYMANGVTDNTSDAIEMAYKNTFGKQFYVSGTLRVPADMAADRGRIDRKRALVEEIMANGAAQELFAGSMGFGPGVDEDELAQIFGDAEYELRNAGNGNGVMVVMKAAGKSYPLGTNGQPMVIKWDEFKTIDAEWNNRFGALNTKQALKERTGSRAAMEAEMASAAMSGGSMAEMQRIRERYADVEDTQQTADTAKQSILERLRQIKAGMVQQ